MMLAGMLMGVKVAAKQVAPVFDYVWLMPVIIGLLWSNLIIIA
ncbi:hypothetical protein [Endozoicomonas montiporae]|nr:hypothetical protein [Endozoicomonas montiporae]